MRIFKIQLIILLIISISGKGQKNDMAYFGKSEDGKFEYFMSKNESNKFTLITANAQTAQDKPKPITGAIIETQCFDRKSIAS